MASSVSLLELSEGVYVILVAKGSCTLDSVRSDQVQISTFTCYLYLSENNPSRFCMVHFQLSLILFIIQIRLCGWFAISRDHMDVAVVIASSVKTCEGRIVTNRIKS
jgi:hypothetical protein